MKQRRKVRVNDPVIRKMSEQTHWDRCIANMMCHINNDTELLEYVKRGPPEETGFMWDSSPLIHKLAALTDSDGHSGASFACCLRACQTKLNQCPE